ncbi:ABC transporter permease, partial [bacterium]
MKTLRNFFRDIAHYPSAVAGMIIILLLVALAVYALIKIPYKEAIRLWRGGEEVWYQNPKFAPPIWYNWFTEKKQPVSFAVKSGDGEGMMQKTVTVGEQDTSSIEMAYNFDYNYDGYPQDLLIYFTSSYAAKQPFVSVYLITPDDRKVRISDFGVGAKQTFRFSQEEKLLKRLKSSDVMTGLFSVPKSDPPVTLKGTYQLLIQGVTFEKGSDINAELVMHGQVAGWAGTDHQRRDLTVSLLWGAPVALAFGLLAAVFTAVLTMIIAAVGAWYGGWIDNLIQRITEVN